MGMKRWLLFGLISGLFLMSWSDATAQSAKISTEKETKKAILPAAYNMEEYLPLLKDKSVALVINQTSKVGQQLLLDTLLKRKVNVKKIMVPEHGFRGTADAGAHVKNDVDQKTG